MKRMATTLGTAALGLWAGMAAAADDTQVKRMLAIVDSIRTRLGDPQPNLRFPDPPDEGRVRSFFPAVDRIEAKQTSGVFDVLDGRGNRLGQLRGTSPAADSVVGYQGPTETVLAIDVTGKVIGLWIQQSYDNQPYVGYVDEEGYLFTTGFCCLVAFILEYLLPKLKN